MSFHLKSALTEFIDMALSEIFTADLLTAASFIIFLQIVFIDLVLAGDNALIVGMVAARVPAYLRNKVILFGVGAAVVMRIGFSLIAKMLTHYPWIAYLGLVLILYVAVVMSWEGAHEVLAARNG